MTSTTYHKPYLKTRKKNKASLVYNQEIDRSVINGLSLASRMNYGELKRHVEKTMGLTIPPKTWVAHLTKMQTENYLLKDDTQERNEKVFYSLTEVAKQLRDLMLLCMNPDRPVFRQIYTNLLFRAIVEGNTYAGDDLDNILREIHASRQELRIDGIKKKYYELCQEKSDLTTIAEKRLPVLLTTHYKPTSLGIKIIESTCYRENIIHKNRLE